MIAKVADRPCNFDGRAYEQRSTSYTVNPRSAGRTETAQWSSAGDLVASADGSTIHLWNPSTGEHTSILTDDHLPISALAWSPDEQFLAPFGASGIDGDEQVGTRPRRLPGGRTAVRRRGPIDGKATWPYTIRGDP
jgi:WD40 repeat protein